MFTGLFSCNENKKSDFVFEKFKTEVEKIGFSIDSVDNTDLIHIKNKDLTMKISLDNVRRDYKRDKDESIITDFVSTLLTYTEEIPKDWKSAKEKVYLSLFTSDYDFKDFINAKITDDLYKIYVFVENDKLSWIRKTDLINWGINHLDLDKQADLNANQLLSKTEIVYENVDNHLLGLIEVERTSLKGALLFASEMKDKIQKNIGFPFYAVIPVRDFCYIFSENDFEYFSNRIGSIVIEEYQNSGYPLTTELLKFSDNGIEAVGKYPIE